MLSDDKTEIVLEGMPDSDLNGKVLVRHPAFYMVGTFNPADTTEDPADYGVISYLGDRSNRNIPLNALKYDPYDNSYGAAALRRHIKEGICNKWFAGTYICTLFADFLDTLRKTHDPKKIAAGTSEAIFPQQPSYRAADDFFGSGNLKEALQTFPYYSTIDADTRESKIIGILEASFKKSLDDLDKALNAKNNDEKQAARAALAADREKFDTRESSSGTHRTFEFASYLFDIMRHDILGDTTQEVPLYAQNSIYQVSLNNAKKKSGRAASKPAS